MAAFLRDLPAAWEVATPEERNVLARAIFQSVEIAGDLVTAIVPQPEFAPFFNLLDSSRELRENDEGQSVTAPDRQASTLAGGSDGDCFRAKDVVALPLSPVHYSKRCIDVSWRTGTGHYADGPWVQCSLGTNGWTWRSERSRSAYEPWHVTSVSLTEQYGPSYGSNGEARPLESRVRTQIAPGRSHGEVSSRALRGS